MIMVTHLFAFAEEMYNRQLPKVKFLSAERLETGRRTFKIKESTPTFTSYGMDLFEELI